MLAWQICQFVYCATQVNVSESLNGGLLTEIVGRRSEIEYSLERLNLGN